MAVIPWAACVWTFGGLGFRIVEFRVSHFGGPIAYMWLVVKIRVPFWVP